VKILGVGNATLDVINTVPCYPQEDDELRVSRHRQSLGGNCANSLLALASRQHECFFAGVLADDLAAGLIRSQLVQNQINTDNTRVITDSESPVSWVIVSEETSSRTILHHRDLPELGFDDFLACEPESFDWIHFEGRNIDQISLMMQHLQVSGFKNFSLEVEKSRAQIEDLFIYPSILMFSRQYVHQRHAGAIRRFFPELRASGIQAELYCGWGKAGGWAMDHANHIYQQPAWVPEKLVDTLAAGDVFNAAIIDAHLRQQTVAQTLEFACHMAGFKCGFEGLTGLQDFSETL